MTGIQNILLLTAICEFVHPDTILTPQNVALQRGSSTELKCRANSGSSVSSWTFTPYQSSIKDVTIYSREIKLINNVTSFRKITDEDEFLNIKTDSVQPQDAGVYTCNIKLQEGAGFKVVQNSAYLIVLDSDPNCSAAIDYSTDGRKFRQLSCSVGFRGNWAPVMEWREGGSSGTIISTGLQSNTSSNCVSHGLNIPVDEGEKNTVSYTCVTFFAAYMSKVNVTATNIPNYTSIWSDIFKGAQTTTETGSFKGNKDTEKLQFIELTGTLAAAVGVLLLLLMIISVRNYKKFSRDSVDEAHLIHGGHLETHKKTSFGTPVLETPDLDQVVNYKRSCSYFAADGTEYMDMRSGPGCRQQTPIHNPSKYEQVVYASIDHTLKAPNPRRYV